MNQTYSNSLSSSSCVRIQAVDNFKNGYSQVHVNLMLIWCPLGVISNILNIIVLNQKNMHTPTNFLLTCLAISDGLIMIIYIPFTSYFLIGGHMQTQNYHMAVYLILTINLTNILQIFSCGIVVTLAVFRLLYAKCLIKCHMWCSQRRAVLAVCIVFFTATVLTIPCMIAHHVTHALNANGLEPKVVDGEEMYTVNYVETLNLRTLVYWTTAIFVKLLPLACLITLSSLLIATIQQRAKSKRKYGRPKLIRHASKTESNKRESHFSETTSKTESNKRESHFSETTSKNESNKRESHFSETKNENTTNPLQHVLEAAKNRERSHSRTTHLMLAVMIVYIVTMLPQGILLIISSFAGFCFSETVYDPLGDFTDLLTLLSCGVNFVLYCAMSQQFRMTFYRLFFHKILNWSIVYRDA